MEWMTLSGVEVSVGPGREAARAREVAREVARAREGQRLVFGRSRETDWALGGAALGLTVALVEFIANSVLEVANVGSRRSDTKERERSVTTNRDDYDSKEDYYDYEEEEEEEQYDYADYRMVSSSRRSSGSPIQTYRSLITQPYTSQFGRYRFDLNKLNSEFELYGNVDYNSKYRTGRSPWFNTPDPQDSLPLVDAAFTTTRTPSAIVSTTTPVITTASTTRSDSSSSDSSPWDRLEEMEEPLPGDFKENVYSNLATRDGSLYVERGGGGRLLHLPPGGHGRLLHLPPGGQGRLLHLPPGGQGREYTYRRGHNHPINSYMGIPG